MKRFLLLISFFVFSILFVACGGFGNNGSSQGQGEGEGEGERVEPFKCNYDGNGGFTFNNFEIGTIILQINGQEIHIP